MIRNKALFLHAVFIPFATGILDSSFLRKPVEISLLNKNKNSSINQRRLLQTCVADSYAFNGGCVPCPDGSTSPAGSTSYTACTCLPPQITAGFNILYGDGTSYLGPAVSYGANKIHIIRNPISTNLGPKIVSWTVTTTKPCTIAPFTTYPNNDQSYSNFRGDLWYSIFSYSDTVNITSAGTFTFPWISHAYGDQLVYQPQNSLGWYTSDSNCVSSVSPGSQLLSVLPPNNPWSNLNGYYIDSMFDSSRDRYGKWAIQINTVPSDNPKYIGCSSCSPNFYYLNSSLCAPCPTNSFSPPGSDSVSKCVCVGNLILQNGGCKCDDSRVPLNATYCACKAGYYGSNTCTICSNGDYCPFPSFSKRPCVAGSYCSSPDTITSCKTGSYCPPSSTSENPCPQGKYCPTPSTSISCPAFSICALGSSSILCQPSRVLLDGECVCPSKTFSDQNGNCVACPSKISESDPPECKCGFYYDFEKEIIPTNNPLNITTTGNYLLSNYGSCKSGSCIGASMANGGTGGYFVRNIPSINFTIAAWVSLDNIGINKHFFDVLYSDKGGTKAHAGTGLAVYMNDKDTFTFSDGVSPVTEFYTKNWGSPVHFTFVFTRYSFTVYLNGAQRKNCQMAYWGTNPPSVDNFEPYGTYDDLVILPYAASDAQVSKLYNNGFYSVCPISCNDGKYNSADGKSCIDCPINSYCFSGAINTCPPGTSALAGSSTLAQCVCTVSGSSIINGVCVCSDGKYQNNNNCDLCPASSYCQNNQKFKCPVDTTSVQGATSLAQCEPMQIQVNISIVGASVKMNQSEFKRKLPDSVQVDNYEDQLDVMVGECSAGYYCPIDTTTAIPCPAGTYNNLTGKQAVEDCLPCLVGQFCPIASVLPSSCAAGSYRDTPGATSQADCNTCPSGSYCVVQSVTPTPCPAGTYRSSPGASSQSDCSICSAGSFCLLASVNPTNCQAGTYNPANGSVDETACLVCRAGNYCALASVLPTNCPAGTYGIFEAAVSINDCTVCPTANWCPIASVTPTNCSAGTYGPNVGAISADQCLQCPAGEFCKLATTTPTACTAGSYRSTTGAASQDDCSTCIPANYCPQQSVNPTPCPAGSFRGTPGAAAIGDCATCTTGHFCGLATVTPAECIAGTHRDTTGASSASDCLLCDTGTYSLDLGRDSMCPACVPNSYCSNPTTTRPCPTHTSSIQGSSSLLNCRCDQGYKCAYSKKITAVVTLNTTVSSFSNDVGGVRTSFVNAVATAAGVAASQVSIAGVVSKKGAGRRLLSDEAWDELIDVHTDIEGAERLHQLDQHLNQLHVQHRWEERHSLISTPLMRRPILAS